MGKLYAKTSPNQREWRRQARRINNQINKYKQQGYTFDETAYIDYIPKRVTKQMISKIQKISRNKIKAQAKMINPSTGVYEHFEVDKNTGEINFNKKSQSKTTWDMLTSYTNRKRKSQTSTQPTPASLVMYDNVIEYFSAVGSSVADYIVEIIGSQVGGYGVDGVAKALVQTQNQIDLPTWHDLFYKEGLSVCIGYVDTFLRNLGVRSEIRDNIEDLMTEDMYSWEYEVENEDE